MLLDLNMWKNQIFYNPKDFGQYTGTELLAVSLSACDSSALVFVTANTMVNKKEFKENILVTLPWS